MKLDIKKLSPAILSGLAVLGVGATAAVSIWCHSKALPEIVKLKEENPEIKKKEIVKHVWKYYIPVMIGVGTTATLIIVSNRISAAQLASMTAAASAALSQKDKLKKKAKEIIGEEKWKEVEKVLADDTVKECSKDMPTEELEDGEVLFYDTYTNICFPKKLKDVENAKYLINRLLAQEGRASLADFYELMHEESPWFGMTYGWCTSMGPSEEDMCSWIDIELDKVVKDDGTEKPYYRITYLNEPYASYRYDDDETSNLSAFERATQVQGLPFR